MENSGIKLAANASHALQTSLNCLAIQVNSGTQTAAPASATHKFAMESKYGIQSTANAPVHTIFIMIAPCNIWGLAITVLVATLTLN